MTSSLIERVGQRIKEFRTAYGERGISQEALATKMGVATNTISRWETATVRPVHRRFGEACAFLWEID